jgi:hypothetical protein
VNIYWRKRESWVYEDRNDHFKVKVVKWNDGAGETIWNKYLYLFPGNKHFGKYRPTDGENYPETPFEFHYGITYYTENFDNADNLIMQCFGDDYNHLWDKDNPVDGSGTSVFWDAENLIKEVKEEAGNGQYA